MASRNSTDRGDRIRWMLVGGLLVVAFFGAYKFASARSGQLALPQAVSQKAIVGNGTVASAGASPAAATAGACAACDGGSSQPTTDEVTGPRVDGTATRVGGIQTITVRVTSVYSPNVIHLAAGVPASITFGAAQGCTSQVQSRQLGFSEDLSAGSKSVRIENPQPGTYDFECGMNMVHGKILVE
jgi:hypothetical protein